MLVAGIPASGTHMLVRFITTGGTIDKIYFDAISQFEMGDSQLKHILTEGLVMFEYDLVPLPPCKQYRPAFILL